MDAARELLAIEKQRLITKAEARKMSVNDDVANFPVVPVTQGQYGSDAYWFLEAKVQDCSSYGETANITCANMTQMHDKFMEGTFNFDFVMNSTFSANEYVWKNLYMEIELGRWTGVETYFKKRHSYETDRFLHKKTQNHLDYNSFDSFSLRSNHRRKGDPFYTFYIRLHDEVEEVKLAHYSFLDAVTDIGGAWEVVIIFMSFGFIGFNYLLYKKQMKKQKSSHMQI